MHGRTDGLHDVPCKVRVLKLERELPELLKTDYAARHLVPEVECCGRI